MIIICSAIHVISFNVLVNSQHQDQSAGPPFLAAIDAVPDIVPPESSQCSAVDEREERLQLMEKQCHHLYNKLVNTTARNAALVGRLTSIHQHYGSSNANGNASSSSSSTSLNQSDSPTQNEDEFNVDTASLTDITSSSEVVSAVECQQQQVVRLLEYYSCIL